MPPQIINFGRAVIDQESWSFDVEADSLYAVSIKARCKNWLQNFRHRFNDDDLAVQIDDYVFAELIGKKREFNTGGSWNGNELNNSFKTILFVVPLLAGKHLVRFFADVSPWLEEISIIKVEAKFGLINFSDDFLPKAESGKLFFGIVTKHSGLTGVTVSAKADHGDKLQLKVDGQTTENEGSIRYKIWYWLGDKLKGSSKEFNKEFVVNDGAHYLELKGVGRPLVEKIVLSVEEVSFNKTGTVALHKDVTSADFVYLRSAPNDELGTEVGQLKNGDKVEILEEVVVGKWVGGKSYIWHKVKFQNQVGFVLSSFVEIHGHERDSLVALIKYHAQRLKIDENLVVALAGCESRYKVYATGGPPDDFRAGKGIFQLSPQLIVDFNDPKKDFYSPVSDVFDVTQNIAAGIAYFKWLHDVRYKRSADSLVKSVAAYNAGPSGVSVKGSLDLEKYEGQTKNLVSCVLNNQKSNLWKNIIWPVILIFFSLTLGFFGDGQVARSLGLAYPELGDKVALSSVNSHQVLWEEKSDEVLFLNSDHKAIHRLPSAALGLDKLFETSAKDILWRSIYFIGTAEDPRGLFYFLAATSLSCGAQNCHSVLYKFDVHTKVVTKIKDDIFGSAVTLYLSPDYDRLAIVSSRHASVCENNSVIDLLGTKTFDSVHLTGFESKNFPVTYLKSLTWENNNKLHFSASQINCADLSKGTRDSGYIYDLIKKQLLTVEESFRPDSKG